MTAVAGDLYPGTMLTVVLPATAAPTPLAHRSLPETAVVIGAGTLGLRAAHALVAHGVRVSVFDRSPFDAAMLRLRQLLLRSPDLRIVGGVDVVGVLVSGPDCSVRGVRIRPMQRPEVVFPTELVVDATGHPSAFRIWRHMCGYVRAEALHRLLDSLDPVYAPALA